MFQIYSEPTLALSANSAVYQNTTIQDAINLSHHPMSVAPCTMVDMGYLCMHGYMRFTDKKIDVWSQDFIT